MNPSYQDLSEQLWAIERERLSALIEATAFHG
jgi:hypothetical protein